MPEPRQDGARDDFDTIRPADVRLSTTDTTPTTAPPAGRMPVGVLLALVALLVLGALVVLVLPDRVSVPERPAPVTAAPEATDPAANGAPRSPAGPAADTVPPFRQLELERQRDAAQEILGRMLELQESLEARAVERWGAEAMEAARATAAEGDERFLEQDYEAAQARYREALEALQALDARAGAVLEQALADGASALEAGDAARATEAFELADAVDPGNPRAGAGLARAAVLDEVRAELDAARRAADAGELDGALERVEAALALDAASPRARSLREELRARIEERNFQQALSDGYGALGAARFEAARRAFERALGLRSGAPEAREGLRIVEQEVLAARIADARAAAEAAEREERWEAAGEHYADALELDPTLAFARDGRARARARAELDAALEETLAATEQLNDPVVFAEARALLDRAQDAEPRTPRLARQLEALEGALAVAAEPVPVQLRSDGETTVTVLRVAELGRFETRELALKPGAYVATGTRVGYRDVRVEFRVTAEGTEAPVTVQCTQRI